MGDHGVQVGVGDGVAVEEATEHHRPDEEGVLFGADLVTEGFQELVEGLAAVLGDPG
ncbi:hypothetical protein [Streptomyces sp. NPDC093261]|uniref:hypothetical protein n=1 Tax=Streptomyces sp. NPDC093261 TaxID=3366037 RepID=UPI00382A9A8C